MFKNVFKRKKLLEHVTPSGDRIMVNTGWTYDDGNLLFVEKSKHNLYESIQACKDSVELSSMLKRYEAGDESALNRVEGMYIDTVDMPKSYAELYTAVARANDVFNSMPARIKEKYHNNPAEYWRDFGTKSFDDTLNAYRAEIYGNHGMVDPDPVQTASVEVSKEVVDNSVEAVDNSVDSVVKGEVINE